MSDLGISSLRNIEVFHDGSIFSNNQLFLPSLKFPNQAEVYGPMFWLVKKRLYRKIQLDSDSLYTSVIDHLSREFYHWFNDAVPRLLTLETLAPKLTLLLNDFYRRDYVEETLKLFSFKKIEFIPEKTFLKVPHFQFAPYLSAAGKAPRNLQTLRRRFFSQFGYSHISPQRVFISRRNARYRHIVNEAEVRGVLERFGFFYFVPEDYHFKDQFKIVHQAETIVGLHGAGLTHILFTPPHSTLIELSCNHPMKSENLCDQFKDCYRDLAQSLERRYLRFEGEPKNYGNSHKFDVWIDPQMLSSFLTTHLRAAIYSLSS